jgi:hypothetical protein
MIDSCTKWGVKSTHLRVLIYPVAAHGPSGHVFVRKREKVQKHANTKCVTCCDINNATSLLHDDQCRSTKANTGQRRPTQANEGQRRPMKTNEHQRTPTKANAGQRMPTRTNERQCRPTKANAGQWRPMKTANAGQEWDSRPKRRDTSFGPWYLIPFTTHPTGPTLATNASRQGRFFFFLSYTRFFFLQVLFLCIRVLFHAHILFLYLPFHIYMYFFYLFIIKYFI